MKETISAVTESNSVVVRETCPERMVKKGLSGAMISWDLKDASESEGQGEECSSPSEKALR